MVGLMESENMMASQSHEAGISNLLQEKSRELKLKQLAISLLIKSRDSLLSEIED